MGYTREITKAEYIGMILDLKDGELHPLVECERHPLMKKKKEEVRSLFVKLRLKRTTENMADSLCSLFENNGEKETGRKIQTFLLDVADKIDSFITEDN